MLPDLPCDARAWVDTDDLGNVPIPCQSRILPPSPSKVLVEIIVRGVGLWCADIAVPFADLRKSLRHSFEEGIPGGIGVSAGVALHDGLQLSVQPTVVDDVIPEHNLDPRLAAEVFFAR